MIFRLIVPNTSTCTFKEQLKSTYLDYYFCTKCMNHPICWWSICFVLSKMSGLTMYDKIKIIIGNWLHRSSCLFHRMVICCVELILRRFMMTKLYLTSQWILEKIFLIMDTSGNMWKYVYLKYILRHLSFKSIFFLTDFG